MGLVFAYQPHPTQRRIHDDRGVRFRAVCCGRRWGKTRFAAAELFDISGERGGLYAWVAPTYYIAERGQKALREIGGDFIQFRGQNPVRANFTGGGGPVEILFLSADNPDTILGDGYDGVIVDEAARIERSVWEMNIRPALADKQGWAVLISTPKARNWFFDFHTRGRDPRETLYRSYSFTSLDNPYFPREEWEEAKRTTPQDIFRQEYKAEFLEDSAGVFRNLDACLLDHVPAPTGDVAIGCDLAKHTDWTVLIAMDRRTGACVDMDRFQRLDWPIQKDRILAFCRKWRGLLVMDATGAGDPIYDDLARVWPRIEAVKFTNQKKVELIQRLVVAIEQRQVSWPRTWEVLTAELKRYEYAIGSSGAITYSAPSGFHDDCVIGLALAASARYIPSHAGIMASIQPRRAPAALLPRARVLP
jgi:hypothetical protein